MSLKHTPVEDLPKIRDELKKTFSSGKTKSLDWRREQLYQLARMVQENADFLAEAIFKDLGKPKQEVFMAEVGAVVERSLICARELENWAKPENLTAAVPDWQKGWKPTVYKAPKGTVLLIAPWNYPLILSLQPLYGAIASGCTAVLKLSEVAAHYAAALTEIFPKYIDQSAYRIVNGAVPEITKLLEMQWDHIFYTGNGKIGRIIAGAAAKHLTPCTLELGGKCPVLVAPDADLTVAARRILWGKHNNAGQICVAPDHVLIPSSQQDAFISALRSVAKEFYGPSLSSLKSDSIAHIISKPHFKRLTGLIDDTKGEVVLGGGNDGGLGIEMTVVKGVGAEDALLSEEIFGPVLPIIPVENMDEAIEFVNARDHGLVMYVFTKDDKFKQKIVQTTMSGNLIFNDTFGQLAVNEIPFGGVGESGYGRQVLKHSFDLFSYDRSSIDLPYEAEPHLGLRYPPYSDESFKAMTGHVFLEIPKSGSGAKVNGT